MTAETIRTPVPADTLDEFNCLDCHRNTSLLNEYYMVLNVIWHWHVPEKKGMLCIGCLEQRMGRTLTKGDFSDAIINHPDFTGMNRSERLINRLTTE